MTIPPTVSGAVQWQYLDVHGAWQNFGTPFDLGAITRTRRAAIAPRQSATAQQWRLVKKAGHDWGATRFALDAVTFWAETADPSEVRVRSFSFDDRDQRYFLVHTSNNIEVYHLDQRVASIPTPYNSAQVDSFTQAQVLDTMLLFHQESPPQRITRQGAHDQWDVRDLVFDSLPVFDYDGTNAGGVNEVQELHFRDYVDGDTFNITFEDQTSDSIVFSTTGATLAANVQAALVAMPNIGAGGAAVVSSGAAVVTVTFQGDSAGQDVGEMAPKTLVSTAGLAYAATITQGVQGGEPIISATRGWPACGCFYQGRLYLGGLKSRPQTILGSRVGFWFKFKTQGADKAISEDLDTDETTPIIDLFPGMHLQVFTRSAEFFFPTEPIIPPAAVKRATRRGATVGVPIAEVPSDDGTPSTLFVAGGGQALCEFLFDAFRGIYSSQVVSKLATHLLAGDDSSTYIVDMGFRRARQTVQSDRAILIRADGLACVMHALREDDVTGFVRWTTQGVFASAAADLAREEYVAVGRGPTQYLEKLDDSALLDSQVSGGPGTTTLTAPWLAGFTATLYMDGADAGDVVVPDDGVVVLPSPALRKVSLGVNFPVKGVTLPAILQQDPRQGLSIQPRVGVIDFELGPTANLKAGLVGGTMWRVPLKRRADVALDEGPGEAAFEGWTQLAGVPGFRTEAQCQFVQDRPGPLTIKQIVLTIDS